MLSKLALLLAPTVAEPSSGETALLRGPIVDTENGKLEGLVSQGLLHRVDQFLGIPFAAPPVGGNRFRPPQPAPSWRPELRKATKYGSICPQFDILGNLGWGQEDCLYLNVYRPHGAKDSKLPVFYWIYGGAYVEGDGYANGLYDGVSLVHKHYEMLVVTSNYRLSGLGFLALPELQSEDASGTTGNYALLDQRAAMQYIQRNIANFGGDPGRVTLAGESAGAFSVHWHLAAPGSRGLFHAAVSESGTSHLDIVFQNKTEAFDFYSDYAASMGCTQNRLECLRALPAHDFVISLSQMAEDILAKLVGLPLPKNVPALASPLFPVMPFGPVVDGSQAGLPDVPLRLIQRGDFAKVPLLLGSNKDGGAYFGPLLPLLWGSFSYDARAFAEWFFTRESDRIGFVKLYGNTGMKLFDRAFRDMLFTCSNREVAKAWTTASTPAFLYMFSYDFGGLKSVLGDAHAFELPFVWQNQQGLKDELISGSLRRHQHMADILSSSWASFIKCHEPRCQSAPPNADSLEGLPGWPTFQSNKFYSFRDQPVVENVLASAAYPDDEFPGDDRCDFWAQAEVDFAQWKQLRRAYFTKPVMV